MPRIDIDRIAPEMTRIHEDGELVCEPHHDETAIDDHPTFAVVPLSDDPDATRLVYAQPGLLQTLGWTVEPRPLW